MEMIQTLKMTHLAALLGLIMRLIVTILGVTKMNETLKLLPPMTQNQILVQNLAEVATNAVDVGLGALECRDCNTEIPSRL